MIANVIAALIGFLVEFLGKYLSKKSLSLVVFGLYYSVAFAFYAYVISVLVVFYNQIQSFLRYMSNVPSVGSGASDVLCKFFGLLDCIGFIAAFESSKPMLFSSLTFMITLILYKEFYRIKRDLIDMVSKFMI